MKRTVRLGGVLVVLGVLIGWLLPSFRGPGEGGSGQDGGELKNASKVFVTTHTTDVPAVAEPKTKSPAATELPTSNEPSGTADQIIEVRVSDRAYAIRPAGDTGEFQPIELEQLVERAKAAKGNEDGIRAKIYRDPSARAAAEQRLSDALTAAGVPKDSIQWLDAPPM